MMKAYQGTLYICSSTVLCLAWTPINLYDQLLKVSYLVTMYVLCVTVPQAFVMRQVLLLKPINMLAYHAMNHALEALIFLMKSLQEWHQTLGLKINRYTRILPLGLLCGTGLTWIDLHYGP